jgi:hypothetical protein
MMYLSIRRWESHRTVRQRIQRIHHGSAVGRKTELVSGLPACRIRNAERDRIAREADLSSVGIHVEARKQELARRSLRCSPASATV